MAELICSELSKTYKNFQLAPTSFQLESGYLTVLAERTDPENQLCCAVLQALIPPAAEM